MGIYDRGYMGDDWGGRRRPKGDYMIVTYIIIINVVLFFANAIITPPKEIVEDGILVGYSPGELTEVLTLHPINLNPFHEENTWWSSALHLYEIVTSGFAHANFSHLLFNMIGLFFFGYELERWLGRKEFLRFYMATIVFGGLIFAIMNIRNPNMACLGASGGVVGVLILFILKFPHRTVYLYFFPVPAWLLGLIIVGSDLYGLVSQQKGIAFSVHLAGAGFAYLYYQNRWNLGRTWQNFKRPFGFLSGKSSKSGPKLHKNDADETAPPKNEEDRYNERLDMILSKRNRFGEAALSREEKDFLNNAGKKFREKYKDKFDRGEGDKYDKNEKG